MKTFMAIAVGAVAATLTLAVGSAGAAAGSVAYSLSGAYAHSSSCGDVVCTANVYSYTGSGSCQQGCTGFPAGADVQITISGALSRTFPPSPCISKSVSGGFSITWSDATASTGTLSGRSRDGKAYMLSGTISGGAYSGGSLSVLVSFPPSPCLAGSFSGGFALYPPSPI
jgi:hypothetical protein